MSILFWIFIALFFWHFIGYLGFLTIGSKLHRSKTSLATSTYYPSISILIMAFNEEDIIASRIENCLDLNYPQDRIEIIVCSDASTDRTVEIAKKYTNQGVHVIQASKRNKTRTREMGIKRASGEIVFFTDADTRYQPDCIQNMVRHYRNQRVGCVGGELRSSSFKNGSIGQGQGIYWKWEYTLRRQQSQLGVLTKVSGANMSMRKELYQSIPDTIDIDQAAGPMVILQGSRLIHEPEALAYEKFPTNPLTELSTRRRLTIRALTAMSNYRELLNPLKHPWLSPHFISYRLLRYLTPFLLLGILISNGFLLVTNWFYNLTFALQGVLYSLGFIGLLSEVAKEKFSFVSWPFAFLWFNVGIFLGDIDFLLGKRIKAYKTGDNES